MIIGVLLPIMWQKIGSSGGHELRSNGGTSCFRTNCKNQPNFDTSSLELSVSAWVMLNYPMLLNFNTSMYLMYSRESPDNEQCIRCTRRLRSHDLIYFYGQGIELYNIIKVSHYWLRTVTNDNSSHIYKTSINPWFTSVVWRRENFGGRQCQKVGANDTWT